MVIMALVTTFITVPLVSYTYPPQYHDKFEDTASLQQKSKKPSLLVCVNKVEQVPAILSLIHLLQSKLFPASAVGSHPGSRKVSAESLATISTGPSGSNSGHLVPCTEPNPNFVANHSASTNSLKEYFTSFAGKNFMNLCLKLISIQKSILKHLNLSVS
jgi:hypothetical protein